jgi:hypothetical protein
MFYGTDFSFLKQQLENLLNSVKHNVLKFLAPIAGLLLIIELLLRFLPGTSQQLAPYLVEDPVLGHRLRPGWSDPSGKVKINSQGYRGEEKDSSQKALVMIGVGAGDTFGRNVTENDKTWPNRLEMLYRKNLPERNIRVLNAGVPGYRLLFNVMDLERRLVKINPDFVLFLADTDHLAASPSPDPTPQWHKWSLLLSAIIKRFFPSPSTMLYDHWPGEATEALQQHLISLIGICRIRNIKVVLSTIANTSQIAWLIKEKNSRLNNTFNHLPPSVVLAAIRSYNEAIRRVASQYGVPLLNSAERGSIAQTEELFLSDEGALQVAQGFLKITRKMGLRRRLPPTNRRESIL